MQWLIVPMVAGLLPPLVIYAMVGLRNATSQNRAFATGASGSIDNDLYLIRGSVGA